MKSRTSGFIDALRRRNFSGISELYEKPNGFHLARCISRAAVTRARTSALVSPPLSPSETSSSGVSLGTGMCRSILSSIGPESLRR